MEDVYVVIASQDYKKANHKMLWGQIAEQSQRKVIVVDIPADRIISTIRGRKDRIIEAKRGPQCIDDNLIVVRPLLFARPEILPDCMFPSVAKAIWECLNKCVPDLDNYRVNFLIYDARWVKILSRTRDNMRVAYYLFDEVRYNGKDGSVDRKRYKFDEYACKYSNVVLTMTQVLADSRKEYNSNIMVLGNGAEVPKENETPVRKIENSAAFIGNFRDWIDEELLEEVIKTLPDMLFVFAGPVEDNMKPFMRHLLDDYENTMYYGCSVKEKMGSLYRMFGCVIIPYKNNEFVRATRPIKIVESVLAGTPVVTVPIDGYQETDFIRFASNATMFCQRIREVNIHPLNPSEKSYSDFVDENVWSKKAQLIIKEIKNS